MVEVEGVTAAAAVEEAAAAAVAAAECLEEDLATWE